MTIQGQMLENTERGKLLMNTIKKYQPKTVVEIGTWKGLGSTKCIIDSINEGTIFLSLESDLTFYNIAKENLKEHQNKVNLIHGTIINQDDVNKFVSDKFLTTEQKGWLSEDLKNISNCENVYSLIPSEIDFLLLDGGEFSTYSEWKKLKSKTKIVALDDIRELKTKQIYEELKSDNDYELISETSDGNGFCIFIKK